MGVFHSCACGPYTREGKGEETHSACKTTLPTPRLGFQKQYQLQILRCIFHPTYQAVSEDVSWSGKYSHLSNIYIAHPLNQL